MKEKKVINNKIEIKQNLRDHYHKQGKLYKIYSKFILPQVIIENCLVLTFPQMQILHETGLLDKLINKTICEHVRFFNNDIVYFKYKNSENICIYCYSNKKLKKQLSLICNKRDYSDEDNHKIFSYCEQKELKFEVYDYENVFECNDKMRSLKKIKHVILSNSPKEMLSYEDFYMLNINPKCYCGKKLDLGQNKCGVCSNNSSCLTATSSEKKVEKKNPYNFIEKLQLNKKEFMIDSGKEKKIKKILDYSFQTSDDIDEYSYIN